jgi:dihydrofolate reductase
MVRYFENVDMQTIRIENEEINVSLEIKSLHDGEFFLLDSESLGVCGYGNTPEEAERDLQYVINTHLLHLFLRNDLEEDLLSTGWLKENEKFVWTGPSFSGTKTFTQSFSVPKMPKISLIAAVGKNGEMGLKGNLPWGKMKDDMKMFRKVTTGNHCIVGRKTWESFGKSLPNRTMHVITTEDRKNENGIFFHDSFQEAIATLRELRIENVFVIGGSEIYRMAIPVLDEVFLTNVEYEGEADVFFPLEELKQREPLDSESSQVFEPNENNDFAYSFYHANF